MIDARTPGTWRRTGPFWRFGRSLTRSMGFVPMGARKIAPEIFQNTHFGDGTALRGVAPLQMKIRWENRRHVEGLPAVMIFENGTDPSFGPIG